MKNKYESYCRWISALLVLSILLIFVYQYDANMRMIHWLELVGIELLVQLLIHCIIKIDEIDDNNIKHGKQARVSSEN